MWFGCFNVPKEPQWALPINQVELNEKENTDSELEWLPELAEPLSSVAEPKGASSFQGKNEFQRAILVYSLRS